MVIGGDGLTDHLPQWCQLSGATIWKGSRVDFLHDRASTVDFYAIIVGPIFSVNGAGDPIVHKRYLERHCGTPPPSVRAR